MTFWEHFLQLLFRRPKPALAALYWHLTRRKVRARNRLVAASDGLPFMYERWIAKNEQRCHAEPISDRSPTFTVILHSAGPYTDADLNSSRQSIEVQAYPQLTLTEPTASLSAQIASADGDFILFLRVGDELSKAALPRLAEAVQANRDAAILYGDEDRLDEHGHRTRPWFKPGWNAEMFLAQDYLSSAAAICTKLTRRVAEACTPTDVASLMVDATAAADGQIVHVPHIISHVRSRVHSQTSRTATIARQMKPLGAGCEPGPFGTIKVVWPLPTKLPLVTIIVPTRDKLELLQPCVESVLNQTDYRNFELLIIDNESAEARTADFLKEIQQDERVRVRKFEGPYNFSAMNNFAVREARGDFVCLLNNDTEVVAPGWLTEMVRYAVRPEIGAVGAKLLYDDGTIQHAGVVVGIGGAAGHAHRSLPAEDPGYFRQPHIAQFVSAITAACLLVSKERFLAVGGLDEEHLAVAFNDVDLCLKLQAAGWKNVYVPHAVLLHHESKTRGNDISRKNIDRFRREVSVLQERWSTESYADPWHNPNLDRGTETYIIKV